MNAVIDTRTAGFIFVPPEGDAAGGAVSGRTVYPVDEPSLDRITFQNPSPKALWYSTRNNANSCERRGVSKREDLLEDVTQKCAAGSMASSKFVKFMRLGGEMMNVIMDEMDG